MNSNIPAFPRPYSEEQAKVGRCRREHEAQTGISLRDYFAAHAPQQPWPWFQPVMPPESSEPVGEFFENLDAISESAQEINKQRYIQWPYAFADAMLEARKVTAK